MDFLLHRKIKIISLVILFITVLGGTGYILISKKGMEDVLPLSFIFSFFPVVSLITSSAVVHNDRTRLRKISRISLFIWPLIFIFFLISVNFMNNDTLYALVLLFLFLTAVFPILHIFIFSESKSLTSSIVFIVIIVVGIAFKRLHLPMAGFILIFSLIFYGIGCFAFGIKGLFLAGKISYLKYVAFFGSCVFTISFFGILFKQQHWPLADEIIKAGHLSLIVGTIILLLTLPSSGFIDWSSFHKRIFLRLILPGILVFLLFIIRYLLPDINQMIWTSDFKIGQDIKKKGFGMKDYQIEIKNGLKQNQVK